MFDFIDKKSLVDPDTFILKIPEYYGFYEEEDEEDYSHHLEFKIFIYIIEVIVLLFS